MPTLSVWQHINVPLPALKYQNQTASGQGKGSTRYAAHSHTPFGVELWGDFEALIEAEGQKSRNHRDVADLDLEQELASLAEVLGTVSREEDVTNRVETLLNLFSRDKWNLSGGFCFPQQNQQIIAKPDLIVQEKDWEGLGVGDSTDYKSPPPGKRAEIRRKNTKLLVKLYRLPFETKPCWKFSFMNNRMGHQYIIDNWEIPSDFDYSKMQAKSSLPESWPSGKQKVFHLIRQLYGQMVADNRRYGILHLYEHWFFFQRTPQEILKISRSFHREEKSPSILQAIQTMVGFEDHSLERKLIPPHSASKAPPPMKKRKVGRLDSKPPSPPPSDGDCDRKSNSGNGGSLDSKPPPLPPSAGDCDRRSNGVNGQISNGSGEEDETMGGVTDNIAATLYPWDCEVYDYTDSILLLVTRLDPTIIVKLQSDPQASHIADEMANEAAVYAALEGNEAAQEVIPRFRGHSTHLGVSMTCVDKELDDFDDIGQENLSESLKRSAVRAVEVLSEAGVLHNDIALRNMVKSRTDPSRAKIIDFGRASFSQDRELLAKQIEITKTILNIED